MHIGVLGGGQLGRMLALAGIPLGHHFRFLDPDPDAPARLVGELISGAFDDREVLGRFADGVDVITYEFENVPVESVEFLAKRCCVYPPPTALKVSQDRLIEKQFAQSLGVPTPRFAPVHTLEELQTAVCRIGYPAVLKTRRFGYDGRGQWVIRQPADVAGAWASAAQVPSILEEYVRFQREVSLIAVRSRQGEIRSYCVVENEHVGGILRQSLAPALRITPDLRSQAESAAQAILNQLSYVGVLAIEFFEVDGQLLFNEMAPRVHNSGHWTIEGATTSQFENHLRAILDWPLGDTSHRGHSAMVNLIGVTPDPRSVMEIPGAHLHLYGKSPRTGRKLGHVTICAENAVDLDNRLTQLKARLAFPDCHPCDAIG
jgi:5-(carboxyamino)imidazole ribonucleotide synthase